MPGSTARAHGHPRLPSTPSDPSCVVIPAQMRSQLSPQCHHLSATTPLLQGAQGVSFLQFPEHLLGPGLELGVVIRNNLYLYPRHCLSCPSAILSQTRALGKCWALGLWGQTSQT